MAGIRPFGVIDIWVENCSLALRFTKFFFKFQGERYVDFVSISRRL